MSLQENEELPKRKKAAAKPKAKLAADRHQPAPNVVELPTFEFEAWLEQRDSVELDDLKVLVDARVAQLKASRLAALQAEAAALGATIKLPGSGKGQSAPVKYADGLGNTWTKRGVKPLWLREAIERGHSQEDFAV